MIVPARARGIRNIFNPYHLEISNVLDFLFSLSALLSIYFSSTIPDISDSLVYIRSTHNRSIKNGKNHFIVSSSPLFILFSCWVSVLSLFASLVFFDLSPFKFHNSHSVILKDFFLLIFSLFLVLLLCFYLPPLWPQHTTSLEVLFFIIFRFSTLLNWWPRSYSLSAVKWGFVAVLLILFQWKNSRAALGTNATWFMKLNSISCVCIIGFLTPEISWWKLHKSFWTSTVDSHTTFVWWWWDTLINCELKSHQFIPTFCEKKEYI